jgi:hypothetical protein
MQLSFKNWLELFWQVPPKQDPTKVGQGAFASYCGPKEADPKNPNGQLPPNNRRKWHKKMKKK